MTGSLRRFFWLVTPVCCFMAFFPPDAGAQLCSSCYTCGDPNMTVHENASNNGWWGVFSMNHGCRMGLGACPHRTCQILASGGPLDYDGVSLDATIRAVPSLVAANESRSAVQVMSTSSPGMVIAHFPIDPILMQRAVSMVRQANRQAALGWLGRSEILVTFPSAIAREPSPLLQTVADFGAPRQGKPSARELVVALASSVGTRPLIR